MCHNLTSHIEFLIADTDNQRVILQITDINDEPPYFINRPLPMQAVVKLNAAPNTPVFTLQARDPDKDHDIHYFLVRDRSKLIFMSCYMYFTIVKAEEREGRKYRIFGLSFLYS